MKKKIKDIKTPMEELTAGYEEFIKGKKAKSATKKIFEKTLEKAAKRRGSK
ncbi:MAG: hypothetical protein JST87_14385 [Bacteroidetes bacterium]|nr:hypothetical protein [Bacteroidota bacterium]